MTEDINNITRMGGVLLSSKDYFNRSKGLYIYEKTYTLDGEKFLLSIIDGYFQD